MNLQVISGVLSQAQLTELRAQLGAAAWEDGRTTAGAEAARIKRNLQLDPTSEATKALAEGVRQAVTASETFRQTALPRRISVPLFSRYEDSMEYGPHTDDAFRHREQLRTDLAATLFLSDPDSYDGGALTIGGNAIRLPAGDLVVYPASSIHRVTAVTRGTRLAAVFWVQSLVRNEEQRNLLLGLDAAIRTLQPGPATLTLSWVHQNLLRMWIEH